MPSRKTLGGIIHTYQKYDPQKFPSPTEPPPDMVSSAFEHLLTYGSMRELTDEEMARAVHLDPSQIARLGPSLDALRAMLEERKRKIMETYETKQVRKEAAAHYRECGEKLKPPKLLRNLYEKAFETEQLRELEQLWYRAGGEKSDFAKQLLPLVDFLGD